MLGVVKLVTVLVIIAAILLSNRIGVKSHDENGEWHCDSKPEIRIKADFKPGIITVDGRVDDWKDIDGSDFPLLPALDPDNDKQYNAGNMTVKAVHDGEDVYFMLLVNGNYTYTQGDHSKCASVALMFQISENASYQNMGGCGQEPDACTHISCQGHEVDIMHFSLGTAIPGRLYGGNPVDNLQATGDDRFGHLVDLYAWSPHCRYLDGLGPSGNDSTAQNDWQGSWWHSSLIYQAGFVSEDNPYAADGQNGTYYFEFSRPLRTMDHFRQDTQFTIGQSNLVSAAFWYPKDGQPWEGSGHYTISCDWITLDFIPGSSSGNPTVTTVAGPQKSNPWNVATAFSLLFSVVAFCVSIFVGQKMSKTNSETNFVPMDEL